MNTIKNKLLYIFPIAFSIITLIISLLRIPFWDETHAFEIARLNIFEILYMTRIEGHYLLWYLILKPFSSISLYPYSMLIINWLFCVGAIFVLWIKSPFDNLEKILITFSSPFVFYFAPVARCYSIGIFFLFLICALFKNRYKKHCLFSWLLLICSNTSLMAFISCFYIWLIYLFQLFKKKSKKIKTCLLFFIANFILFLIQFFNVKRPYMNDSDRQNYVDLLFNMIVIPRADSIIHFIFNLCVFVFFYYLIFYLFKKSKYALFYMLSTFLTLTSIFVFVFHGSLWNYYFYFVFSIVLFWIFYRQIAINKFLKCLITIILVFLCLLFCLYKNKTFEMTYSSKSKLIAEDVINNVNLDNVNLYCLEWWSDISPASDIYFKKRGIDILDQDGYRRTGFESIRNIFINRILPLDYEKIYNSFDFSKKNYIITDSTLFYVDILSNHTDYQLNLVYENLDIGFGIYELVKKY